MIRRYAGMALVVALLAAASGAQELSSMYGDHQSELQVWPLAGQEVRLAVGGDPKQEEPYGEPQAEPSGGPSPRLAGFMSALVPGAGQIYAGSYRKGAIFLGVEAAAVGIWYTWRGKGNDIEDEFRATADEHWDPTTYLAWRITSRAIRNNSFTHALPCSLEVEERRFGDCGGTEKQQYYELLGKYDQFVAGWDDLTDVATGNPVTAYTEIDSVEKVQSPQRLTYEEKRNDSNRYLKRASQVSSLILVNHVFSLIDAARTASRRSRGVDEAVLERRTRFYMTLHPSGSGHDVPMLVAWRPFD